MDQFHAGLWIGGSVDFQTLVREDELHEFQILRIVIDNYESHGRMVLPSRALRARFAHELPASCRKQDTAGLYASCPTAIPLKASSTCRMSWSRVNGLRRIDVPASSTPCGAISPSV